MSTILTATFSFDSRDRLTALDVTDGETSYLDLEYIYDNNSNITQLVNGWRDTNSNWNSDTESYSYDGLDRLTSASCTSWSHTYSYDKVGNRTSKDGITYTVNTVNEVTALSDGTSFTYDDNGNRTQKTKGTDTWDYTYDYENRLKKVEENSSVIGEYVYDGDGTRIQVTEDSVATTYIYSGLEILYEDTMNGTAVYIYGPTGRIAKRTTINQETNTFYYHTDHLGSTRLVTDSSKNIVSAAAYHPFGEPDTQEGSEPYLFTDKERDFTGLYYYGARYYDAELGRFITRDPLKGKLFSSQSLNLYTYCLNNPIKYKDPLGLSATFADEEAQQEYEEQTSNDNTDTSRGTDPLIIEVEENVLMTFDVWGMSGNVLLGYGYITNNQGATPELEGEVFCIVVFDDDGNVADYETWDASEVEKMKSKKFAEELMRKAGDENLQDLSNALNALRKAIHDKVSEPLWKPVAVGATFGAGGTIIAGPALPAAIAGGAIFGGINSLIAAIERRKWHNREGFFSNIMAEDQSEIGLPDPV